MQRYFSQNNFNGHINKLEKGWTPGIPYEVNGDIPLVIYTSNCSKLRVAIAETPGPLVKGLISFVTEALDNNGLPHTLEHLIFMGSKKYPYKGVLDLIANRCMASGTNAFTAQDHTAYELTTVGSDGFLKILPIYIDHLLSPTLTDAQFMTEVHHINGKGENAGVVYSEMQEYESEMSNIVSWKRKELFYPEYNPYRVETGGRLAALRKTCNMEKIRRYHHDFYHISNMFVTVCGSIDHSKLLQILSSIEETSQQRVPHLFNKPFRNTMLVFTESQERQIVCPSEDEKLGTVEIAWIGPSNNYEELRKLEVLANYLSDTAASPLQQDFVQLDEQLASSVHFYVREQCISEIVLCFNGVPVNELPNIKRRFFDKTLPETFEKNFDPERMENVITHMMDKELSKMETDCHNVIFDIMCMYQIYGKFRELTMRLNYVTELRRMLVMKPEDWMRLSHRYLIRKCVCVMGYPSQAEVTRIATTEKKRIEEQRKKLGKDGLRRCAEKLEKALHETTAQKPPPELLSEMMIHELENFATFNVQTLHARTGQNDNEIFKLPLPVLIHSVETHFVKLILVWDTKLIPLELRLWLMLYFELIFQSPAIIDDRKLSYEEIANLYTRDLVSYSANIGVLDHFDRFCSLTLKTVPERYVIMLSWLTTFVRGIIFEAERVKVTAQSLIADADEEKRDGCEMQNALLHTALFHKDSNYMCGLVQLEEFHKNVLMLTKENPTYVIDKLEKLREALMNAPINLHIICNTEKIMPFLPTSFAWLYRDRKFNCELSRNFRNLPGESVIYDNFGKQRVIAVGSTESSFLKQSIPFKYQLGSKEGLAVQLIAQYLSQMEGTLFKAIRGNGLAYGVDIEVDMDNELLSFSIYRSSQLEQAYEEAKKVVFNEFEHVDEDEFEAAKRSLVSKIVQTEDTVINAAHRAIFNEFRELPSQFWREYVERIWNASMKEMVECSRNFVFDLFDDKKCCRAIAVPHGKLKDIEKHFEGIEVVCFSDLHIKTA
ncbi:Peptidase M16 inactive domain family protein [Brugia pahangi]